MLMSLILIVKEFSYKPWRLTIEMRIFVRNLPFEFHQLKPIDHCVQNSMLNISLQSQEKALVVLPLSV